MMKLKLIDPLEVKVKIAESGRNLSQFSTDVGISRAYLSQILNGTRTPSPSVAAKIAEGIGGSLTKVFKVEFEEEAAEEKEEEVEN